LTNIDGPCYVKPAGRNKQKGIKMNENIGMTRFDALHDKTRLEMERLGVPGVALGIIVDGHMHTAGFGVTSIENPLAVDGDTLFQIGSTTKTFTGTAVMRLVESGQTAGHAPRLELDTPLRAYLPELELASREAAESVTMRHLLTHTSGWVGDYFEDFGPGPDAVALYVARMRELPQLTRPGELWSYNNANFWLAGRVIEVVSGKTWEAAIKELVLSPLGLRRSFFFADEVITHRFAVGHHVRTQRTSVARRWSYPRRRPSGSIISSATDQLRYAHFHMGDGAARSGERLLSAEAIAAMQTPLVPRDLRGGMMGLTWMLDDIAGTRIVRHGGSTNGQRSAFLMAPSRGFAMTVLTNSERGATLHRELTRWALQHYLGLDTPEPVLEYPPSDRLVEYAGRYETPACALNIALPDIELVLRESSLWISFTARGGYPTKESPQPAPPAARLAFSGPDRIMALDHDAEDQHGEFLRDDQGRITWFRWGSRIRARVR
jgi:CubicO group peptidase (beta-lactamase class C family)